MYTLYIHIHTIYSHPSVSMKDWFQACSDPHSPTATPQIPIPMDAQVP